MIPGTKPMLIDAVIAGIEQGRLALLPQSLQELEVTTDQAWATSFGQSTFLQGKKEFDPKVDPAKNWYHALTRAAELVEKEKNAIYIKNKPKCEQRTEKYQQECEQKNEEWKAECKKMTSYDSCRIRNSGQCVWADPDCLLAEERKCVPQKAEPKEYAACIDDCTRGTEFEDNCCKSVASVGLRAVAMTFQPASA